MLHLSKVGMIVFTRWAQINETNKYIISTGFSLSTEHDEFKSYGESKLVLIKSFKLWMLYSF